MMTNRSDELQEYIEAEQQRVAIGERARNGDTEAALEALDQWNLRHLQEMGPPDVERAQKLYRDGEVNEQELEVLIESAMQYYPPDGKRENIGEPAQFDPRYSPEELILRIVLMAACGGLVAYVLLNPHTVPL